MSQKATLINDRKRNPIVFFWIDCLGKFHEEPVQTYQHNQGNEPWQLDYLFLSERLKDKLENCYVTEDPNVMNRSDHNPVVAELNI